MFLKFECVYDLISRVVLVGGVRKFKRWVPAEPTCEDFTACC